MFSLIYHTVSIILDGCPICSRSHRLPWDPSGEGGDGVDFVSFGVGYHFRLYQEIYGGDEGYGAEGIEMVNMGLFPVLQLVLFKEISRVSHLHWCWFDLYGENQHQRIFKATVEGLTKDWPGGSYIVLRRKTMVPGERQLLAIGYNYSHWNVLSFVATAGAGSTT